MTRIAAAVAVAAVAIASCASPQLTPANVDRLQPGVSSRDDAVVLLGQPMSVSALPDGNTLLQWMETRPTWLSAAGSHVAIVFNPSGRMVGVQHRFFQGQ